MKHEKLMYSFILLWVNSELSQHNLLEMSDFLQCVFLAALSKSQVTDFMDKSLNL